jgi:hypothetical protein
MRAIKMQPTEKSHAIDELLQQMFGVNRKETISENKCVFCGTVVKGSDFRDENSLKEFTISGICQSCQDEIFGV